MSGLHECPNPIPEQVGAVPEQKPFATPPHTDGGWGEVQFLDPQGSVWHPEGVPTWWEGLSGVRPKPRQGPEWGFWGS